MDFNLADLFECVAGAVPDRVALVVGNRRVTFAELDQRAARLGALLAAEGVRAGDAVGLQLPNGVEHVEAMFAAYKIRAVPISLNWRYTATELAEVAADAGLRAIVQSPTLTAVPGDRPEIVTGAEYEQAVTSGPVPPPIDRSADDHYVLYTGGTTGQPKGVVWRQEDIFFAVLGAGNPGGPPIDRPEQIGETVLVNRAQRLGPFLGPDDEPPRQFVVLPMGPLMHASGQWSTVGGLLGGATVVVYDRPSVDMTYVLDLVEREGVVSLNLVGDASAVPLLDALAAAPDRWDTSSLRLLGSGGTLLSAGVKQRLLDALPTVVAITEAIGSSEAPVQGVAVVTRDGVAAPSLRFTPRPETVVFDEDFRPIEAGSTRVGRLATRGRVPIGYHNDSERTRATFVEIDGARWALPGDMAMVDADGAVRVLGRGAMCINTGGEKVYPEEVEAALKSHASVADAIVVGVPDERWGQQVAAVVVLAADAPVPTLEQLQTHCRASVAGYKVPRRLVVVDALQRTAAGKSDYGWAAEVAASARRVPPAG